MGTGRDNVIATAYCIAQLHEVITDTLSDGGGTKLGSLNVVNEALLYYPNSP